MSDTPRTDGKIAKCLDLCEAEACGEYVRLCSTLERELAKVTQERDSLRTALEQSCTDARNESPEAGMGACPQCDALRKERDTIADAFADVAALFFNEAEWDYADVHPRAAAAIEELAEARRQAEVITQECVALRRARAEMHDGLDAVYQKYSHLDYLRYKAELDPWHECVRNFMGAVAIALGYEPKAAQSVKGGDQ
jgi:hypothetical protein